MANTNTINLTNLFVELKKAEQTGEFEKGHRLANKILNIDPKNQKAKYCRIICKIYLEKFDDALKEIDKSSNDQLKKDLLFERAYCEYRLNKIEDCFTTLDQLENEGVREKELKAQAFYRNENFISCYKTYLDLIKNFNDDFEQERATNIVAALSNLKFVNKESFENQLDIPKNTFEHCYNKACLNLSNNNYDLALNDLNKAEEFCKKTILNEEIAEEELETELYIIRTQIGFANLKIGNTKKAFQIFNEILKQKPTDDLRVIINNNIVAVNQNQSFFDSIKKMKLAVSNLMNTKLMNYQKKIVILNNCSLELQTKQINSLKEKIKTYYTTYPEEKVTFLLFEAALLCAEKQSDKAIKFLENVILNESLNSIEKSRIILYLAQIYLDQNDYENTIKVLQNSDELKNKQGVISVLVALYIFLNKYKEAKNILLDLIDYFKKKNPIDQDTLFRLYEEVTNIMIEHGGSKEAIPMLEELQKVDPSNIKVSIKLINAYFQTDITKAKELSKKLPPVEEIISGVDVELYESSIWSAGAKYVKKKITEENHGKKVYKNIGDETIKKKRKRKIRYPKNYDPKVKPDPERWLPKWQRSTYKKKKNDRKFNVGKGTQGSVAPVDQIEPCKQSPRPIGNSPMQKLTKQQRLQKKKKGRR